MLTTANERFCTLADPTRRALFGWLCRDGELAVRALTDRVEVSQPAVSKQLGVLKQAGLVRMLGNAPMDNDGRIKADKTIRYKPEKSVLKFEAGDEIRLNADDFARLSTAFFDEIERKYP